MYIADAIYLVLKGFEITRVSLRNNALKKFPKKIINKFPNLTIFNIEGNEISEFPQEFEELTSMKGLNAANNKLTSIPEGIFNMKHLAILDLSGNLIEGSLIKDVARTSACGMITHKGKRALSFIVICVR
ncbi:leucine Rich repeat-containing domain protein [Teladorsagia circumcincta]|uniref:Leucine Rich repeat-containing domain protein n=1 Tax=Teladorsagia circumcincta TaxID=45464 RepID=A0A2G9UBY0_TELCI|nr:leucine Rich repeat-containing domain protein [Teladorsagia circumcincta]